MPLDLRNIGASQSKPLVEPRAIYSASLRPWPYLRHEQGEVLERWHVRRDDRDVVIKQNTGGGKTVVGLLIAQSTLNEGIGRAVYLAPDNYLAAQVRSEAAKLGIAVTDNPRDQAFKAKRAILVTTLAKLINGKSVFGVAGDGRTPLDLGIVVVDDAHAALASAESQFKLTIPSSHPAYGKLTDLFAAELSDQSLKTWTDIREGDYSAVQRVPFWAWSEKQPRVMEILYPHKDDDELMWQWPLIGDVLKLCVVTVTSRGIEIRPTCPPIRQIPSFVDAARRVYLTATLADDSILVTDLDADPALVATPVTPGRAADLGDRMILAPIQLNPDLDESAVVNLARQYADGDRDGDGVADAEPINVVVLVPSNKAALRWSSVADSVYTVSTLEAGVASLKSSTGQLVVLVNKYDGVDLPGDACRMLIIDGIPRPLDGAERREAVALSGSRTLLARQVQRVEQGMGRGVRDTEDYCVVLLLGADLADTLNDPTHAALLSPGTRTQVDLSREIAEQIEDEGLAAIREAMELCLTQDEQWVRPSRRVLAEVEYDKTSLVRPDAIAQRKAFDAAAVGQIGIAVSTMEQAVNAATDRRSRAWLTEQLATFMHETDPARAQQILAKAVIDNPAILRPAAGVPTRKIKAVAPQAQAAATYLAERYADGVSLVLGVRNLLDRIDWGNDRTDEAEGAWEELGQHLGMPSERPEQLYGTGPDNLWMLAANVYGVFELKTGSETETISKSYVDQLAGSVRWAEETYGTDADLIPISIHPSSVTSSLATQPPGMHVITADNLEKLKDAVRSFAVTLAQDLGKWGNADAVAVEIARLQLGGKGFVSAYTTRARSQS